MVDTVNGMYSPLLELHAGALIQIITLQQICFQYCFIVNIIHSTNQAPIFMAVLLYIGEFLLGYIQVMHQLLLQISYVHIDSFEQAHCELLQVLHQLLLQILFIVMYTQTVEFHLSRQTVNQGYIICVEESKLLFQYCKHQSGLKTSLLLCRAFLSCDHSSHRWFPN